MHHSESERKLAAEEGKQRTHVNWRPDNLRYNIRAQANGVYKTTAYMFRAGSPKIVRSSRLSLLLWPTVCAIVILDDLVLDDL